MALSGVVLFGFLVAHMLGNLQLFVGPQAFNGYSEFLHSKPALLWAARAALLLAALLHMWSAFVLWSTNRQARPVGYRRKKSVATSYAARTMVWTGPIVILYLGYHLAHLTFGFTDGLPYVHSQSDVYANVVHSFQFWPAATAYLVANVALGFHLYHGAWSLLQTLGVNHPRYNELLRSAAVAVALVVVLGFISVPAAVLADGYGLIQVFAEVGG